MDHIKLEINGYVSLVHLDWHIFYIYIIFHFFKSDHIKLNSSHYKSVPVHIDQLLRLTPPSYPIIPHVTWVTSSPNISTVSVLHYLIFTILLMISFYINYEDILKLLSLQDMHVESTLFIVKASQITSLFDQAEYEAQWCFAKKEPGISPLSKLQLTTFQQVLFFNVWIYTQIFGNMWTLVNNLFQKSWFLLKCIFKTD